MNLPHRSVTSALELPTCKWSVVREASLNAAICQNAGIKTMAQSDGSTVNRTKIINNSGYLIRDRFCDLDCVGVCDVTNLLNP